MEDTSAPTELLHPDSLQTNVASFKTAFQNHGLRDDLIYFACKANSHPSFLEAAKKAEIGIDVTSEKELADALAAGLDPVRIIVTSAIKTDTLLQRCVDLHVTTVVDNFDELKLLQQQQSSKTPIMIRLGGWQFNGTPSATRFGFLPSQISQIVELCQQAKFDIRGVQFHLKGYSLEERTTGIEHALGVISTLREAGFQPEILDIGGGIPVSYLASETEWIEFNAQLQSSILDRRDEVTFNRDGLGFFNVKGEIVGAPSFYPYWNKLTKGEYLDALLKRNLINGQSVAKNLKSQRISLQIEPGRALLDQCGCLLAKVAFNKTDSAGRHLTGLFMNRTQLMSSSSDFCVDPIALSERPTKATYLVGSYCIESDVIMKRRLHIPELRRGELLLIPNTAAYVTSLFASNSHGLGEVRRVVLEGSGGLP
jgi:diaminopimelate decarboxylase